MRVASLDASSDTDVASSTTTDPADAPDAGSSFDERFSGGSAASSRSLTPSASFDDRFGPTTAPAPVDVTAMLTLPSITDTIGLRPVHESTENVAPPAARIAAAAPAPHAPTRSIVAAPKQASYRVASLTDTPAPTAYAPADPGKDTTITDLLKKLSGRGSSGTDAASQDAPHQDAAPSATSSALLNDHTAIYDISAHIVYMPNGDRLEAHSGLGEHMDDVRSVNVKHYGPTPPNVYELKLREASFHGVQAIRLNPMDGSQMYGRDGILAHPFMLGPNGQSNGCVSFKDYDAFLKAYQRGDVTRMVVVDRLNDPPGGRTAADWLSNTFKSLFWRS